MRGKSSPIRLGESEPEVETYAIIDEYEDRLLEIVEAKEATAIGVKR
jgi:hypothetical protein